MQINEEIKLEEKLEDITGITCIYVPVSNVYKAVQWYEANLGCKLRKGDKMEPGMEIAILRFPDHNGNFPGPGLRQTVPAIFLMTATQDAGSYGYTFGKDRRKAAACFTTPRIQEMYNRFKENGVNIVTEIPENRPCGPNFAFCDPDGNKWEIWQPPGVNKEEYISEDITEVTCIYVPVKDVYESIKWYQKNLGCEPTNNNPVRPGMEIAILKFPDHIGNFPWANLRSAVPAIFLGTATQDAGSYGFTFNNGHRKAVACFITPRIQEMYNRFKENGVNIVTEIPENRPCGPNFAFCDPDGNKWEIWRP